MSGAGIPVPEAGAGPEATSPGPTTPLVSVVIPAHNQRPWIQQTLDSVLAQTYPRVEVIMVDDGSTDGTGELVREAYGPRVRIVPQPNRGLSAARNAGVEASRGIWIQLLDGDDLLEPEKIATQVAAITAAPDHDLAYCEFVYFGDDPSRRWTGWTDSPRRSGVLLPELLKGNFLVSHAALTRRAVILEHGGFDPSLKACEDYDLWLRLAEAGCRFLFTPGALALYRQRPGSMSRNRVVQLEWTLHVLDRVPTRTPLSPHLRRRHARTLAFFQAFLGFTRLSRASTHARRGWPVRAFRDLAGAVSDGFRAVGRLARGLWAGRERPTT